MRTFVIIFAIVALSLTARATVSPTKLATATTVAIVAEDPAETDFAVAACMVAHLSDVMPLKIVESDAAEIIVKVKARIEHPHMQVMGPPVTTVNLTVTADGTELWHGTKRIGNERNVPRTPACQMADRALEDLRVAIKKAREQK